MFLAGVGRLGGLRQGTNSARPSRYFRAELELCAPPSALANNEKPWPKVCELILITYAL